MNPSPTQVYECRSLWAFALCVLVLSCDFPVILPSNEKTRKADENDHRISENFPEMLLQVIEYEGEVYRHAFNVSAKRDPAPG
jgi:hypothetical protein